MFNGQRVLAVVPARGGSKSIPRKNVRLLAGHPLLAWSVAAGLQSQLVDRVLVSTDDAEIRDVAMRCVLFEAGTVQAQPQRRGRAAQQREQGEHQQ